MKKITGIFLNGKLFPLLLLFMMLCTYAIQLPHYGFYLDDWVSIAAYDQGGEAGLVSYGMDDTRPFSAWITAKFFSLLGVGVLPWQIITLFWRFAAALCCWLIIRRIWPRQQAIAAVCALLFGCFPFFRHQAICIAYFMILMQYFDILLSFLLTVLALQSSGKPAKYILFILSYLTSVFHLVCLEYYISLEAARFLIIWFTLSKQDHQSFKKLLSRTLLIYLPYALILLGALAYRFIYIPSISHDIRSIQLLERYPGTKFPLHILSLFLQYLSESFLGVWYRSINPSEMDLTTRNTQLALGLGILLAALLCLLLKWSTQKTFAEDETADNSRQDIREILILGLTAMLLGFLPGMMIDVSPSSTYTYHDRYLLPSFWGISLFTIAFIRLSFRSQLLQRCLIGTLICVCVFFQIQNSFMYRYSWKYQQQFQWSMKWRIPDIQPNTAVFSDGAVASFMGGWADGSMLVEMYGKHQGITPTPYWYFNIADESWLKRLQNKEPIYEDVKMYDFEAESGNSLVLTKPEYGKCLWLLDEADSQNPYLESGIGDYIPFQNKTRILYESQYQMSTEIFGSDYTHDWCYYFENADRAFDMGHYEDVLNYFSQAESAGYSAGNPTEMRPFIKAAAFSGNWEQALQWSLDANAREPQKTSKYFANLWKLIERDTLDSAEKSAALASAALAFAEK